MVKTFYLFLLSAALLTPLFTLPDHSLASVTQRHTFRDNGLVTDTRVERGRNQGPGNPDLCWVYVQPRVRKWISCQLRKTEVAQALGKCHMRWNNKTNMAPGKPHMEDEKDKTQDNPQSAWGHCPHHDDRLERCTEQDQNLALLITQVPKWTQVPKTKHQKSAFLMANRNYLIVVTKWSLNKTRYRDNECSARIHLSSHKGNKEWGLVAKIPLAQDPNESREKHCGVQEVGVGGEGCLLTDRTCYSQHQSNKCEELLVDSWQQISAQRMRWVICKEQSLWLQPKNTLSLVHSIHGNVSKVQTWLGYVSFSKNIEKEGELFFLKKCWIWKSLYFTLSLTGRVYFQHNPELDSSGRDGDTVCPVFCCPNAATLITVSPSDRTLVFLLLACWLAARPGQLDGGITAQMFTLLAIAEGWKAHVVL